MGRVVRPVKTHHLHLSERGDTIVEVMISLIVISTILTGAFLVARTSSQNIRSSQEHSEALQLLQGQVEMLRSAAGQAGNSLKTEPTGFCMSPAGQPVAPSDAGYADSCQNQGSGNLYTFAIDAASPVANGNYQFTFAVSWDRLGGGSNHESLVYRLPVVN